MIASKVIFQISNRSETLTITTGMTLGALLFILYINDLINTSKLLKFIIYAADTSIVERSINVATLIVTHNIELSKVAKCFPVS